MKYIFKILVVLKLSVGKMICWDGTLISYTINTERINYKEYFFFCFTLSYAEVIGLAMLFTLNEEADKFHFIL